MKFAAIAVVASLALVACKNNKAEEPVDTIDTTAIEQVVDEIADSVIDTVDLAVVEEPAPAVKKTSKKAAQPAEAGVKTADNTSKAVAATATDNNIKEGEATKVDNVKRTGRR